MKTLVKILSHKEVISPINLNSPFIGNYKCHCNCLSYYLENKGKVKAIIGGLQVFEDEGSAAHFIVELNNGKFVDPTFGNLTDISYGYFIPIEKYKPDTFIPNRELTNLKHYFHKLLPFWIRWFKNKDDM